MQKKDPTKSFTIRIPAKMLTRLQLAADSSKNPFAPTMTAILLRGIELALKELGTK